MPNFQLGYWWIEVKRSLLSVDKSANWISLGDLLSPGRVLWQPLSARRRQLSHLYISSFNCQIFLVKGLRFLSMSSIAQFFPPSIRIWSASLSFLTVRLKIIAKSMGAGQDRLPGGGRTLHMKGVGMLIVSLRGANFRFWSHVGCSGQNAIIFSHEGLV